MELSRRHFVGMMALAALPGCARVKQSRIGQLAPDLEFGGDGIVKLAVLADLHLAEARNVGIVGRAVNAINNDKAIDFVVVLGDLTENGTLPQMNLALQALGRLEKPYYCVPGEHDLNAGTEDAYEFYHRNFKKSQWRTTNEGWVFVGLDTCNGTESRPAVSAENLDWIENQLSHTDKKKPIILLAHHPLHPAAGDARVPNAEEVLIRFSAHNLRVVATGHLHQNQVEEQNGILFTSTAPCSATVKPAAGADPMGYRVFTLDKETVQHEFVAVT